MVNQVNKFVTTALLVALSQTACKAERIDTKAADGDVVQKVFKVNSSEDLKTSQAPIDLTAGEPLKPSSQTEENLQTTSSKALALRLTFSNQAALNITDPRMFYGKPPNNFSDNGAVTLRLLDNNRSVIDVISMADPRWLRVWDDNQKRDSVIIQDSGYVDVTVPFSINLTGISLIEDNEEVSILNLENTIRNFCAKQIEDKECQEAIKLFDLKKDPKPE